MENTSRLSYKRITLHVSLPDKDAETTGSKEEPLGRYKLKLTGSIIEDKASISLVCNPMRHEENWSLHVSYMVFENGNRRTLDDPEEEGLLSENSSSITVLSQSIQTAKEIAADDSDSSEEEYLELSESDEKETSDEETDEEMPGEEDQEGTITVVVRYQVKTSEYISAKWDTYRSFSEPWKNSDVVFVVEEREVHCHGTFLRVHCSVLDKMLTNIKTEMSPVKIPIEKMQYEPFLLFISLFYLQNIPLEAPSLSVCMKTASIQHQYKVSVGNSIEKALLQNLNSKNALRLFKLGLECELECLQEAALFTLREKNLSEVEVNPVYHSLDSAAQALVLEAMARAVEDSKKLRPEQLRYRKR